VNDKFREIYRVQVLERVFEILDALAAHQAEPGLQELSQWVGLHRSTAHRLLTVLEGHRFVERTAVGKYRLGSRLLELGTTVAGRLDVAGAAKPFLERLVSETGETAHMGVLRQGEVVSITNVHSLRTLSAPATVGRRSPVHSSSLGKCLLSGLSRPEVLHLVQRVGLKRFTLNTITTAKKFLLELQRVRECGYAIDDEEYEEGLRCIGAPVRDHTGRIIAAISVAGPATRLSDSHMPALAASVVRAAIDLSAALGFLERGE
jgi:DNA-binding IclR family transcriptional regulator